MPERRYFLDRPFAPHQELTLPRPEAHHLEKVMRASPGDEVELINGKNQLAKARVLVVKKDVSLEILSVEERAPHLPKVILCQAIPRLNRLETIVEKGTELGMHALWLFPGERSEKKTLSEHQLKRLKAITISAIKQCGRLDLPEILLKPPLSKWEELSHPAYFGDISPEAPTLQKKWQKSESCYFFIGPESGFSPHEMTHLCRLEAHGVTLHHNILRTETASIVALSQIFNLTSQ